MGYPLIKVERNYAAGTAQVTQVIAFLFLTCIMIKLISIFFYHLGTIFRTRQCD